MKDLKVIFKRTYDGFESFSDYWRDMDEAVDPTFNPEMASIPGEFQGTLTVTITYTPSEDDPQVDA